MCLWPPLCTYSSYHRRVLEGPGGKVRDIMKSLRGIVVKPLPSPVERMLRTFSASVNACDAIFWCSWSLLTNFWFLFAFSLNRFTYFPEHYQKALKTLMKSRTSFDAINGLLYWKIWRIETCEWSQTLDYSWRTYVHKATFNKSRDVEQSNWKRNSSGIS